MILELIVRSDLLANEPVPTRSVDPRLAASLNALVYHGIHCSTEFSSSSDQHTGDPGCLVVWIITFRPVRIMPATCFPGANVRKMERSKRWFVPVSPAMRAHTSDTGADATVRALALGLPRRPPRVPASWIGITFTNLAVFIVIVNNVLGSASDGHIAA
jgi:hypothetical protein